MKIVHIEPILLSVPMAEPIRLSFGQMTERKHLFLQVTLDDDSSGIGEIWVNFPSWNAEEKLIMLDQGLIPMAKQIRFIDPYDFQRQLKANVLNSGAGKQWGAFGHIMQAISGIDIAVWDAYARGLGVPLYKLLGGQNADSDIPAYASGLGSTRVGEMTERALNLGFKAIKVKIGFGQKIDVENLRTARQLLGDLELFVDANQGYLPVEAESELKRLEEFGISFVEEPIMADELATLKSLNQKYKVAGGENLYGLKQFKAVDEMAALSVWQPDVTKTGGISEFLDILNFAPHQLFAPHMYGAAIGQAASLSLMWARKNAYVMETEIHDNPFLNELVEEKFYRFFDGRYVMEREMSGLGIKLNKSFIEKYRKNKNRRKNQYEY